MSARSGKDRIRRDHPQRSEEKSSNDRISAPPSRHLWVGNLSQNVNEKTLTHHFSQFGDLESIAFQHGRSYAFVNFKNERAAFAAMRELQGFFVVGSPLRIEFTKAEKSTSLHDEGYLQRGDGHARDYRSRRPSPESAEPENQTSNDKNTDPSEVLWIGFPSILKVDEAILRKSFSPFGEIEKITAFPGRPYAFVRFKTVVSACRAKENLQGKLFSNPRVHICFARSESGGSSSGRNSTNVPPSPSYRRDSYLGNIAREPSTRSPNFGTNLDSGDRGFKRKGVLWDSGDDDLYEQRRLQEIEFESGRTTNLYGTHIPLRDRESHLHDFPPDRLSRRGPIYNDTWDLPEQELPTHGAKKLKANSFPLDSELPEFPFSDAEQLKHVLHDFPRLEGLDKNFDSGHLGYSSKQIPYIERNHPRNASYDNFQVGDSLLPSNLGERQRFTPELHLPSRSGEWKWEGTIAKGGSPVCRARCFPVGKVLDMVLPDFLDCTARTGLDMLAQHYYQAANSWVVFFVPESDVDMGYYNEFMNYLGEKQRAAVAKLDDVNSLFLVPPSEFSEKVLKVPGKLSISGLILRLEPLQHPHEGENAAFMSFHGEAPIVTSFTKQPSPSGPYPSVSPFPNLGRPKLVTTFPGNMPVKSSPPFLVPAYVDRTLSALEIQNLNAGDRIAVPQATSRDFDHGGRSYNPLMVRSMNDTSTSHYPTGIPGTSLTGAGFVPHQETKPASFLPHQETRPTISSSMPAMALQPDQLAKLASSLLGQPRQSGSGISTGDDASGQFSSGNTLENTYRMLQKATLQSNQVSTELMSSPFTELQQFQQHQVQQQQLQQFQQQPVQQHQVQQQQFQPQPDQQQQVHPQQVSHSPLPAGGQGSQSSSALEEQDSADPQKRLEATLQLAAALLQQIQQGKK